MKTLYKSLILAVLLTTSVTAFAARHTSISSDMLNGEWAIEKVNGKRLVSVDDDMPYLIFNTKQNLIYASDGHNTVNAFYTFNAGHSANAVKFSNVVASHNNDASSTKALVNALNNTNAYSYEEGEFPTLHLYKGDSEMLTLRKLGLSVLDGAWKVKAVRNNTIEKEDEIQLVIDTTDGRVYGNTGFNIFRGTIWIETSKPRAIQFQNITASENETDNQRNETQLLVALEEVESIKNVKGNTVTLLDGTGKPAIVLERITISRDKE
ncbi:MAG: META domain-containing protein [Muribaculaceae bacterium]|nr:META domain-containing protein [Muribaculaceae bacterium]